MATGKFGCTGNREVVFWALREGGVGGLGATKIAFFCLLNPANSFTLSLCSDRVIPIQKILQSDYSNGQGFADK